MLTRNDSGTSLLVADLELVVDHFDGEPAASRTISVRDGRQVAIQVPYGVADECDSDNPVGAALTFTYTTDIDPEPKHAAIELDGTDLLDEIRTEQCTTRTFDDAVTARFVNTAIVGGAVVTDLVLEPTGTAAGLVVTGASGTILMGVRVGEQWAGASIDDAPVVIPLRFVVNRCDPHALAEVTKRYGLDVAVSADGAEPVTVAVDVADLVADFETVVEQCTISAAADD